jgi:hypothetical protein
LGFGLDQRRDAFKDVHHLRVHRVRDPQRAILVEGGDALGGRNERRGALGRGCPHELDDALFGWAVVPGRQRIGLCLRVTADEQQGAERQGTQDPSEKRRLQILLVSPRC